MPKLQKITRANGSHVYSVNIPRWVIEQIEWEKGDELHFGCKILADGVYKIEIRRDGDLTGGNHHGNTEEKSV